MNQPPRSQPYTGPVSPGTGQIPEVPPPVLTGPMAPLTPQAGPPQPAMPGHQPPPGPGMPGQYPGMPGQPPGPGGPAYPPRKSKSGLVIGLVIGLIALLLLCGGGGAAVWFFVIDAEVEAKEVFPQAFEPVNEQVPPKGFGFRPDFNLCEALRLDPITSAVPISEGPVNEEVEGSPPTGSAACTATLRGKETYHDTQPTGTFGFFVTVHSDTSSAADRLEDERERYGANESNTEISVSGIGEEADAYFSVDNNVTRVYLSFRNGNLSGFASLGFNAGEYYVPPDHEVMLNILVDLMNGATAQL